MGYGFMVWMFHLMMLFRFSSAVVKHDGCSGICMSCRCGFFLKLVFIYLLMEG